MAAGSDAPQHLAAAAATPGAGVDGTEYTDWARLLPELVRKIADEKLLPVDVSEYIRLRAVCKPWRSSTADPSLLHARFFPRNWLMLKPRDDESDSEESDDEEVDVDMVPAAPAAKKMNAPPPPPPEMVEAPPAARRFVNVRTGDTLHIQLPPVEQYGYVLTNAEGLLLLNCERTNTVRIFNPLTMAVIILPGLANAPVPADALIYTSAGIVFDGESPERPTIVLVVAGLHSVEILYATPGADHWGTVDISAVIDNDAGIGTVTTGAPPPFNRGLSLHGRFFVATRQGDVLEVSLGAPHPQLVYVARPPNGACRRRCMCVTCHLVPSLDDVTGAGSDNDGMLLVRCYRMKPLDVFRVHVRDGSYTLLMMLGNRTVFLPSTTLRADKFQRLPQGTVHQQYEQIEDYIGKPTSPESN